MVLQRGSGFGVLGSGFDRSRFWGLEVQEITLDNGEVRDAGGAEVGGQVAVDFVGDDRFRARGEMAGECPRAGADLDKRLVGFRIDRTDDFLHPRRLEKVLAEALARADHSASPRQ